MLNVKICTIHRLNNLLLNSEQVIVVCNAEDKGR